jgi:hypothetical protein
MRRLCASQVIPLTSPDAQLNITQSPKCTGYHESIHYAPFPYSLEISLTQVIYKLNKIRNIKCSLDLFVSRYLNSEDDKNWRENDDRIKTYLSENKKNTTLYVHK